MQKLILYIVNMWKYVSIYVQIYMMRKTAQPFN